MIYFPTLLFSIQAYSATTAFIAGTLIVATVLFIIFTSSKGSDDKLAEKHKVYHVRDRYFLILTLAIIVGLIISLRFLPYEQYQGKPAEEVTVVAMQWAWKMAPGISNATPEAFTGESEITLPANKLIRFVVTSQDVNHGFGIYNPEGLLIAQTQAMPQYKNELEHKFTEPGDYHILCMEYCGMPHAYMIGTIHVK